MTGLKNHENLFISSLFSVTVICPCLMEYFYLFILAPSKATEGSQSSSTTVSEYTCCHCLLQTAATESRPIGLVTLIQSSSVLAHKHESANHLVLPTTEEEEKEELPPSWSDSLGLQYDQLFAEMNQTYDSTSCLLAVHRGWKGGIHIQSCGHHMHYDCRSSYCETLRSQLRLV